MTGEDFAALFDAATRSVFRYEALQTYAVAAEDPSMAAFRGGSPRPERSVRTSPWLRRIAVQTAAGVSWSRVRFVTWPLSEYVQWELVGYVESQAAGEAISIIDEAATAPDFWLVDEARAVLMRYNEDGAVVERELITDPEHVAGLVHVASTLRAAATPLNTFLTQIRGGAHV